MPQPVLVTIYPPPDYYLPFDFVTIPGCDFAIAKVASPMGFIGRGNRS
jgi:hypothetical protein